MLYIKIKKENHNMASYKNFDFKKLYFIVYIALILIVVFLAFKLGIFLFPFTIALFFSILTRPFTRFLQNKLKLSKKLSTIISIVCFFCLSNLIESSRLTTSPSILARANPMLFASSITFWNYRLGITKTNK